MSEAHTILVLRKIVERCNAIKSKTGAHFDKLSDDIGIASFVEGAIGFCEATKEEEYGLWDRLVRGHENKILWSEKVGIGVTIGYLNDRPVHVVLRPVEVSGHKVIFYEATSTVVDHDMVRAFIEFIAPVTALNHAGALNHTDAANFTNILPKGWRNA